MVDWIATLISGFLGAVIGSGATVWATKETINKNVEAEKNTKRGSAYSLLHAFLTQYFPGEDQQSFLVDRSLWEQTAKNALENRHLLTGEIRPLVDKLFIEKKIFQIVDYRTDALLLHWLDKYKFDVLRVAVHKEYEKCSENQ